MEHDNTVGRRIAYLREQAGISQAELAKMMDVSPSTIAMWETGGRGVKAPMLAKLSACFRVRTDYLVGLADRYGGGMEAEANTARAAEGATGSAATMVMAPVNRAEPAPTSVMSGVATDLADSTADEPLDDPEIGLFFKDFRSAPKERREEMLRFWNFIKEREKDRQPGDEQ